MKPCKIMASKKPKYGALVSKLQGRIYESIGHKQERQVMIISYQTVGKDSN